MGKNFGSRPRKLISASTSKGYPLYTFTVPKGIGEQVPEGAKFLCSLEDDGSVVFKRLGISASEEAPQKAPEPPVEVVEEELPTSSVPEPAETEEPSEPPTEEVADEDDSFWDDDGEAEDEWDPDSIFGEDEEEEDEDLGWD